MPPEEQRVYKQEDLCLTCGSWVPVGKPYTKSDTPTDEHRHSLSGTPRLPKAPAEPTGLVKLSEESAGPKAPVEEDDT